MAMNDELVNAVCDETGCAFQMHRSSFVDDGARVGHGSVVWHFSHIMAGAQVGSGCNIGQNVFIGDGVVIGDNVKIQNNVSIYNGVTIEDEVFLGPACVLTNVINPRAEVSRKSFYDKTLIKRGTTIGANSTILCGVELGCYCFVAAGSVVTKNINSYSLVMGNPARHCKWIGRQGLPLQKTDKDGILVCPETGYRYKISEQGAACLDLDEYSPLPDEYRKSKVGYREI